MRFALVFPVIVIVGTAAAGLVTCMATGINPHTNVLIVAALACLAASLAGVTPLLLTRGASQLAMSQAGLVGTVAHLFIGITVAAALYLGLKLGQPFLYWTLAFYWTSLVAVVIVSVRFVKAAPVTSKL